MLRFIPGEIYSQRIVVQSPLPGVISWIAWRPVYNAELRDWVLFVKRRNEPARSGKCPTQLEIESHLRAWLLRHHKRRLFSTSFAELPRVDGQVPPRERLNSDIDSSEVRWSLAAGDGSTLHVRPVKVYWKDNRTCYQLKPPNAEYLWLKL